MSWLRVVEVACLDWQCFITGVCEFMTQKAVCTAGGKPTLVPHYHGRAVRPFQLQQHKPGHMATNYARWVRAETPYVITVAQYEPYEPWGIMHRWASLHPWVQERAAHHSQSPCMVVQTWLAFGPHRLCC